MRKPLIAGNWKMFKTVQEATTFITAFRPLVAGALDDVEILPTDVVVSSHACGALTDRVLERAVAARARVAVLPCCHDLATCDAGALTGWIDGPAAIDIVRALGLQQRGYRVRTQAIPAAITPKNRLLMGAPEAHNDQRSASTK